MWWARSQLSVMEWADRGECAVSRIPQCTICSLCICGQRLLGTKLFVNDRACMEMEGPFMTALFSLGLPMY